MRNFCYFIGFLFFVELIAFGIGRYILAVHLPMNTYLSKKYHFDLIKIFFGVGVIGFIVIRVFFW